MSTVESHIAPFSVAPVGRLLTVADLAALPLELPSGPIDYELDNGRLVLMSPAGHRHGSIQSTIAALLKIHGEWAGHGRVYTDVGVVLWRNPDRVVSPDVAFIRSSRHPVRESPEGYLETIPDWVVEVRSKNDSWKELNAKAADYLRAGVDLVWIVDGDARTVTLLEQQSAPRTFRDGDTIPTASMFPGYNLPVTSVFDPPASTPNE